MRKYFITTMLIVLFCSAALWGQVGTIGTGTDTNTTTGAAPINIFYRSIRTQTVYTAAELNAAGIIGPSTINSIAYHIFAEPLHDLPDFQIRMAHTTQGDSSSHIDGPYEQVYFNALYSPTEGGWDTLDLATPFAWNGVDNILVDTAFSQVTAWNSSGQQMIFDSPNGMRFARSDGSDQTDVTTTEISEYKPQIQFGYIPAVTYDDDLAAISINGPNVVNNNVPATYSITIMNMGDNTQSNYTVKLMEGDETELASVDVTVPIESFETSTVDLTWTPTAQGDFSLYGKAVLVGDENLDNDETNTIDVLVVGDPIAGTYEINQDGTGDYTSFGDAVSYMTNVGIGGPVVFEVAPGVYNEQIVIPEIMGASEVNTITFTGSGFSPEDAELTFEPTDTNARHIVKLDGAKHLRFDNMSFTIGVGAGYGFHFHIQNEADDIEITNNILNNIETTSSGYVSIVASGSNLWSGLGNNVHNILIANNVFNEGYAAIRLNGESTNHLTNAEISNNEINITYYYGMYFSYLEAPIITGNSVDIRSEAPTTTYGAGLYLNHVHGPFLVSQNNIENAGQYGIYLSNSQTDPAERSRIVNNSVGGGFRNTGEFGGGIRMLGTVDNMNVLFNSFNVDFGNGAALNIRVSSVTGLDVRNNSFAYTGEGTGYAIYFDGINSADVLDYNNYHSNGDNFVYYGSGISDLAALQAVNMPVDNDQNSLQGDPMYTSATHLLPYGPQLFGAAIPIPGIDEDITGSVRDAENPSIGAYEFELPDTASLAVNPSDHDFGVLSAGEATDPVNFTLTNVGSGLLTIYDGDITITGDIDDFTMGTIVYPIELDSGLTEQIAISFSPQTSGAKEIYIQIVHDGDNSPNTIGPLTGYALPTGTLIEGFEGVWPPEDWTVVNGVDGSYWEQHSTSYSGDFSARTYQGTSSGYQADEWLITPLLNLDAVDDPVLMFHGYSSSAPDGVRENMRVMILDQVYDNPVDLHLNATLIEVVPFQGAWSLHNVDLDDFSGYKHIAFNYYITADDNASFNWMYLDDVVGPPRYYPDYDLRVTNLTGDLLGPAGNSVTYQIEIENRGDLDDTYDLTISGDNWNYTYPASIFVAGGSVEVIDLEVDVPVDAQLGDFDEIVFTAASQGDLTLEDSVTIVTTAVVTYANFPYFEDFEDGSGGWIAGAIDPSPIIWELGTPAQTEINSAYSGVNAWMTGLTEDYPNSSNSWLLSPPFDFSDLDEPHFSVRLYIWTENNYDGMIIESSIDSGNTWQHVRADDVDLEFYTNNSTSGPLDPPKWSGQIAGGYAQYSTSLTELANEDMVYLRFRFQSDTSVQYEGIAVDDVRIWEPTVPELAINPASHDFGQIEIDVVSAEQEFVLSNAGAGEITIYPADIQLVGDDSDEFNLMNITEAVILDGTNTATVSVSFAPVSIGLKSAILEIDDNIDPARNINVTRVIRNRNETRRERDTLVRVVHQVSLTGEGYERPVGSTCLNPLLIDLPVVDYAGNTEDYGNDYLNDWVDPSSSYLNGHDFVTQFTVDNEGHLSGSISGSWTGLFILEECPDPDMPAPVIVQASGSTGGSFDDHFLSEGTYFAIVSTWPVPQFTDFTLNLSFVPAEDPAVFAIDPTEHDFGMVDVGTITDVEDFTITNIGAGIITIAPADIQIVGTDADEFNLVNITETVNIAADETVVIGVSFAPLTEGNKEATLQIEDNLNPALRNLDISRATRNNRDQRANRVLHSVALSGEGYEEPIVLYPPENLVAEAGDGIVGLSWNEPDMPTILTARAAELSSTHQSSSSSRNIRLELEGYNIYRDNSMINTELVIDTEYTDTDVVNGVTYEYYVTAVYDEGESDASNTAAATPEDEEEPVILPPTNLTANLVGADSVILNWEAPEFGDWIYWDTGENAGNSIGTGDAAQFKVAQRFSPDNLQDLGVGGSYLTEVRFFPREVDSNYAINVWTGGTATQPGALVVEQPVPNPVIDSWNTIVLDSPVFIDDTQELWFGYDVDTQTGFPAGCDEGPAIDGYGNMMYLNGQWDTLLGIAPTLNYNWNVHGFAAYSASRETIPLVQAQRSDYVPAAQQYTSGSFSLNRDNIGITAPQRLNGRTGLTGYRVYRNDMIAGETDADATTYLDEGLEPDVYEYYVTALYDDEESEPSNSVVVNTQVSTVLFDDFEDYDDFALQFPPWTLMDLDQSPTYGITDVTFPNEESPMAYIIFNPSETTPPLDIEAYSGDKMAASFAATAGPNNDWMITPQLNLGDNSTLSFWARSYTSAYGLERMRVGVSATSMAPATFTMVTEEPYAEVPTDWTQYTFDLSEWDNQNIWIAINCVSDDAFILFVDDFHVQSVVDVNVDDPIAEPMLTSLNGNYPNPFNPETTISFTLQQSGHVSLEIYNIRGQKVATVVDGNFEAGNHNVVWNGKTDQNRVAGSGIYFYRMKSGDYSSTRKMIMMK
jgi:hypothetical protein